MKTTIKLLSFLSVIIFFGSCTENYSNGERVGLVTQFSNTGIIWKSWEGHLNMTQTGMNSSTPFDFSVDNDNEDEVTVKTLDSAATFGWKVKITYHQTAGKNWFGNRGMTDHFVSNVQVLDKNPVGHILGGGKETNVGKSNCDCKTTGKVIDTIYVMVVSDKKIK